MFGRARTLSLSRLDWNGAWESWIGEEELTAKRLRQGQDVRHGRLLCHLATSQLPVIRSFASIEMCRGKRFPDLAVQVVKQVTIRQANRIDHDRCSNSWQPDSLPNPESSRAKKPATVVGRKVLLTDERVKKRKIDSETKDSPRKD